MARPPLLLFLAIGCMAVTHEISQGGAVVRSQRALEPITAAMALEPLKAANSLEQFKSKVDGSAANLKLSERATERPPQAEAPQFARLSALILAALMMLGMSPVLYTQGFRPFAVVLVYVVCLTCIKISVKLTLQNGLAYPYSLTAVHMLITALVACVVDHPLLHEGLMVLPVACFTLISVVFGNMALLFGGVAFVAMLACCTPAMSCIMEVLSRRREPTWRLVVAVMLVCAGSVLCIKGESTFSWITFFLVVTSAAFRSMKCMQQHDLLQLSLPPVHLTAWTGIWATLMLVPLVMHYEGMQAWSSLCSVPLQAKGAAALSTLVAVALNFVQCTALQYLGVLMQQVVGNLQLVLVIVLASASLREAVTPMQWVGVAVLVVGILFTKESIFQKGQVAHGPSSAQHASTAFLAAKRASPEAQRRAP